MSVHLKLSTLLIALFFMTFNLYGQKVNWRLMGENKDANFYEIQKDFNDYWKDKDHGKGEGYGVFKRWENKMAPRVYPTGNLNPTKELYHNYENWRKKNNVSSRSPNGNWVELGPLSKPSGYDAGVGRIDFVTFHPTDNNIIFVSTPDGGLWKTSDAMSSSPTWTTNNDFLAVIGCSDLVIAPDGMTMYLATGSWESDKRSIGIMKSTDGGETWNTTGLNWALTDNYKIKRLIMDPTNPLIMMAASDGGLWRTTDGWATAVTSPVESLNGNFNIHDLTFKPGDPNTVYASGRTGSFNEVFWKSTDKGVTWINAGFGLPDVNDVSRIILGVTEASGSSTYVYAIAGNNEGGYLGTYRSTDSGDNFSEQSTSPNILNTNVPPSGDNGQATHDLAIAVSPTNPDILTIGGINQYRSTDGGETWDILTYWYGTDPINPGGDPGIAPYLHADVQSIQYSPTNNSTIYSTCDGGISRSTDNGMSWTDLSHNLRVAQMTEIALSASNPDLMVTGLQDIGTLKNTNGVWTYIGGGDGESAFIDYTDDLNIVTSDPNGNYRISTDGGINQEDLNGNGLPQGTEFNSPIKQDPRTPTTCFTAGREDLYVSDNFLDAPDHLWESAGTPSGTGSIINFIIAPSDNQVIYTIKENAVSKTVNRGDSWSNVTGQLPVGDALIKNITISDTDPNKVWVVFSGYSATNKVFKTTDGGSTWSNVSSSSLPNIPINTVVYRNGSANDEVYIGADIGVYVIHNDESNWIPFNTGIPNCTVNDLEIYYPTGRLRAATYGRGAWDSDLYSAESNDKNWTYIVYLVGSDLESGGEAGTTDIQEIIAAGATDNVNVVVLTGGADKDGWRIPSAKLYSNGVETVLDYNADGKAMSSSENVTAFIDYALANYPGKKVGLTFWNHGSDIRGYGNDEVSGENLSVPKIKEALQNTQFITNNNKFELLGFDACLMGNLESVSTFKDFTKWYIGSEEQEPGHGWNYTPIIQALNTAVDSFSGADLGRVVVDGFVAQAISQETNAVTLGVINPVAIPALENSLTTLFTQLVSDDKISKLHKARAKAEEYSKSISNPENSEDMVDIGDLMKKLKQIDPSLATLADDVISKLAAAVSYTKHDMARPRATGLAMYIPHNVLVNEDELYGVLDNHYYNIDFKVEIRNFIYDEYVPKALSDDNPPGGALDPDFTFFKKGNSSSDSRALGISALKITDVEDLEQVQILLIEELEGFPDEYQMLGSTHPDTMVVNTDGTTTYAYRWDELWISINEHPAYISDIFEFEMEDENGEVQYYTKVSIPAVSNLETPKEEFLILTYLFDEDFNYELESIIPEPYEDQNGNLIVPKQRVFLKPGDQVQLLYEGFNEVTDEEFFVVNDDNIINIVNGNVDLELGYDKLEVGNYQLAYLLEDHSQNDTLIFDPTIFVVLETGVETIENNNNFVMYPNPTSGRFSLDINNQEGNTYDLIIFDNSGRLVHNQKGIQGEASLDLDIPNGIYTIEVIIGNKRIFDKLVIQK